MKKTVKVNLGGYVFLVDEDAYDLLKAYLLELEQKFNANHEGHEILEDIERRIAELLFVALEGGREVVSVRDIKQVVETMGRPADFDTEEPLESAPIKGKGRLCRNRSDAIIGGVASGLAQHFGVNAVWVRLAFLLTLLAWTFGLWIYVILWAVLPVNPMLPPRVEEHSASPFVDLLNKLFAFVVKILTLSLRFVGLIIGLIFILAGFPALMAFVGVSVFPSFDWFHWEGQSLMDVYDFFEFAIVNQGSAFVMLLLAAVIIIPVLMLTYWGVRLVFRLKVRDGLLHLLVFLVWIGASIFLAIFAGGKALDFRETETDVEKVQMSAAPDTLWLLANNVLLEDDFDASLQIPDEGLAVYYNKDLGTSYGRVILNMRESDSPKAFFKIKKEVCSANALDITEDMSAVSLNYSFDERHLVLDNVFRSSSFSKPWIPSLMTVYLYVPKETVIVINKEAKSLLKDERYHATMDNELLYID